MPHTTAQKLKIHAGSTLLTINVPTHFRKNLEPLPEGIKISDNAKNYNQIHWFVKDQTQMEKELKNILPLLKENVICWIYYPKGSSKIQTDLSRDKGWDALLKQDLQWVNLISFDDTWSAFGMRQKKEKDKKKETKSKERPISKYIDAKKKIITLPDDFASALKKVKKQETFFNALSFTNRKEYVEWIVSAKREKIRATRVKESIERLAKEWRNPRNK